MNYNKEASLLYEKGLTKFQITNLYQEILEEFYKACGHVETDVFIQKVKDVKRYERSYLHQIIDESCKRYLYSTDLTWREVKFEPKRIKRCKNCNAYFYDVSRNGRSLTCNIGGDYFVYDSTNRKFRNFYKNGEKLSVCGAELEIHKRTPIYKRKVNMILTDFFPAEGDIKGQAWLDEINIFHQNHG
ncbi:CGNR zinc finger domain-containing protein [Paraliobacillus salinarum]|uniref:CGNR zinc finger domain-containing protein n=1 Tax=Paraliobacillus salinarum TaxID=1158996 RepID=UPI0015F48958|nr:CGNR zinc finger domain-containing protein [Paraliobacillus salinarum]